MADGLVIGYDAGSVEDITVLTVGRRNLDGSYTILNTYQDGEAKELYLKLTAYKNIIGEEE